MMNIEVSQERIDPYSKVIRINDDNNNDDDVMYTISSNTKCEVISINE